MNQTDDLEMLCGFCIVAFSIVLIGVMGYCMAGLDSNSEYMGNNQ